MTVGDVIERHDYFAHRGDPDAASEAWEQTGREAGEVEGWLKARCFDPEAAEDMDEIGITPDMASVRANAGSGGYVDTIGCKVAAGDLGLAEACAVLDVEVSQTPPTHSSATCRPDPLPDRSRYGWRWMTRPDALGLAGL